MLKRIIYLILTIGILSNCAGADSEIIIRDDPYNPTAIDETYTPFDWYRYYGHERVFYRHDLVYGRPVYQYNHN